MARVDAETGSTVDRDRFESVRPTLAALEFIIRNGIERQVDVGRLAQRHAHAGCLVGQGPALLIYAGQPRSPWLSVKATSK